MTRAIVYARVSRDARESGLALAAQELACIAHTATRTYEVVATLRETTSGIARDRPALKELRELLRHRQFDVLVVVGVDRLSRHRGDVDALVHELRAYGAKLEVVA